MLIRRLLPLLIFFLILDFEFTVGSISGEGERLGAAAVMEGDVLVSRSETKLGVKISDLLLLALFTALLLIALKKKPAGATGLASKVDLGMYKYYILLFAYMLFVLIFNRNELTSAQFFSSLSYLLKYIEISFVFIFSSYYLSTVKNQKGIYRPMFIAALLAGVIGVINPFIGSPFYGWLIPDRVEYFGILALISILIFSMVFHDVSIMEKTGFSRTFALWLAFILGLSVFLCGKRTPMVGYVLGLIFVFFASASKRNFRKIFAAAVGLFAVGVVKIKDQIAKSIGGEYFVGEGLSSQYAEALSGSIFSEIYGLDLSSAERLGKLMVGLFYFADSPFLGIGFYTTQYKYDFLPDSVFQVPIELGIFGSFLMLWPIIRVNARMGKLAKRDESTAYIVVAWRGACLALAVMGLFANVAYIFKLIAMFLLLTSIARFYEERASHLRANLGVSIN